MRISTLTGLSLLLMAGSFAAQAQTAPADTPAPLQTDVNGTKLGMFSRPVMLYDDGDTAVHFYGLIEATIGYANNQSKAGNTTFGFQVAWFSGNRYGFDMDHVLSFGDQIGLPGLKVISKLEGEFELPSGGFDTDNTIFNRDCWVGFYSDTLGKLTFGRQNTLTRDFTQNWGDAYGTQDVILRESGYSNVNNFKQFIFYSAAPGGTRSDSSIVWKKKFGDHVVAGLEYGFSYAGAGGSADPGVGGALPGQPGIGASQQASLAYNRLQLGPGQLSLNVNYDRGDVANLIHQAELVGGNYVVGPVRVNAGYVHYTAQQGPNASAQQRTDNSWTVSTDLSITRHTVFALGIVRFDGRNAGTNASGVVLNPFFGNTSGVTNATEVNGGKATTFGSIMYSPDRNVDLYVAFDYMKALGAWDVNDALGNSGPYGVGQPHNSETEIATGMRFKF
jgi:predicted porin